MIEIDQDGLDEMDKRLLEALIYKFNGGPVGLSSIAVSVGEDASTLEEVHEPFLIMQGFLKRTPVAGSPCQLPTPKLEPNSLPLPAANKTYFKCQNSTKTFSSAPEPPAFDAPRPWKLFSPASPITIAR